MLAEIAVLLGADADVDRARWHDTLVRCARKGDRIPRSADPVRSAPVRRLRRERRPEADAGTDRGTAAETMVW